MVTSAARALIWAVNRERAWASVCCVPSPRGPYAYRAPLWWRRARDLERALHLCSQTQDIPYVTGESHFPLCIGACPADVSSRVRRRWTAPRHGGHANRMAYRAVVAPSWPRFSLVPRRFALTRSIGLCSRNRGRNKRSPAI